MNYTCAIISWGELSWLRSGRQVAQDNVQRPGADGLVHHGDETALVLEVYDALEP